MELRDWLTTTVSKKTGKPITMDAFGKSIGRAQSIVSRLANKKHWPDRSTAVKIVMVTAGRVTLDDLYSLPVKYRNGNGGH